MKSYCEHVFNEIKKIDIPQCLLLFYIVAVLGWTWEFLLRYQLTGTTANWGVMHGPWAPIYGFGGIFTLLLAKYTAKRPLWLFAGSMLICTVVEYGTSVVLEGCYGMKWWDYSSRAFNLQGRICPEVTLFFGVVCLFLVYMIIPWLLKQIHKIPVFWQKVISSVFFLIFVTDAVISLWNPNTAGLL